jgi:hypothetical protein
LEERSRAVNVGYSELMLSGAPRHFERHQMKPILPVKPDRAKSRPALHERWF